MDPINWFISVVTRHYADFAGRARRAEFWWFALVWLIAGFAFSVVQSMFGLGKILTDAYTVLLLMPVLAVAARRLHDTGRSGWLVAIGFVPLLLWRALRYAPGMPVHGSAIAWLIGLAALAGTGVLLVFEAQPGTRGENPYGPDPKAGLA